jgi:Uma2 family endonuclease
MGTLIQSITAEQLLHMPNDSTRRELIAGELKEMTPEGPDHGEITLEISVPLGAFIKQEKLGRIFAAETGFLLASNPDTVRAPDFAFVSNERLATLPRQKAGFFPGPPDLAVEVISPNDVYSEVQEKVGAWLNAGCRLVVVVNPRNRTLELHRAGSATTILGSHETFEATELFPGFQLPVREIFPCDT